jgi:uncharacterized membrane protein (UPF0136 family)
MGLDPAIAAWWSDMVGTFSDSGYRGRSLVATLTSVAVVSALAVTGVGLVSGCNSGTVQVAEYVSSSSAMLDVVAARLVEVRKPLTQSLADTGNMQKALAAFRKSLADNQSHMDRAHAPAQCRQLDQLMAQLLDKGRDAADVSTQFADYFAQVAPLAGEVAVTVDAISKLQPNGKTTFGLVGTVDKSRQFLASFQSMIATSTFQAVQQRFGDFLTLLNERLTQAAKVAPDQLQDTGTPAADELSGQTESLPSTARRDSSGSPVDTYLGSIPEEWANTNLEMTSILSGVAQTTGYASVNAEFDATVLKVQQELQALKAKYGISSGK